IIHYLKISLLFLTWYQELRLLLLFFPSPLNTCSSSTVSLCARFSLICRCFGSSPPSLSPSSLRRESNEHHPISRIRRTRCHPPPEVDCLPHQSCSCRHLSTRFWPVSRRRALSPPLPLASSHRDDSNEPRLIARSLSTHRHAPPENRFPHPHLSLQKTHLLLIGFPLQRFRSCHVNDLIPFLQTPSPQLDLCFLSNGLDSATCRLTVQWIRPSLSLRHGPAQTPALTRPN
ncbi:hypothetical protein PIB30_015118, partial [Stylosanthes scabra]|nr:hypothetical protein [Stylosanthes scabra]